MANGDHTVTYSNVNIEPLARSDCDELNMKLIPALWSSAPRYCTFKHLLLLMLLNEHEGVLAALVFDSSDGFFPAVSFRFTFFYISEAST